MPSGVLTIPSRASVFDSSPDFRASRRNSDRRAFTASARRASLAGNRSMILVHQSVSALAGLGLFLSGLHMLATSTQQIAGRRVRKFLGRHAKGTLSAAMAGTLLGAVTQSSSAAAFICIGLLGSGALELSTALALSAWASVGTSLLVFLAAINMQLLGLYALGVVGITSLLNVNRYKRSRDVTALIFSMGLLFLGLGLIKEGAAGLRETAWVVEFFRVSAEFPVLGFLLGVVVTLVTQSSGTVSILALTLNLSGVLPLEEAIFIVCGANLGSGLSIAMATSHLVGQPRQLALWQCFVKFAGVIALMPLWVFWPGGMSALVSVLTQHLSVSALIAYVYLALQVLGAVLSGLFVKSLLPCLIRLAPEPLLFTRFAPRHLYAEAVVEPGLALPLARLEQARLLAELPAYLDPLRLGEVDPAGVLPNGERHQAAEQLLAQIVEFVTETASNSRSDDDVATIFALTARNEAIHSLQDSLHSFVNTLDGIGHQELASAMVESLHLILTLLVETLSGQQDNREFLVDLTADRGDLMEGIRQSLLLDSTDRGSRQSLFVATSMFERLIWLVRQVLALGELEPQA
jgi:phosphate:Na+ symporter